tara:strand:+ start:8703 stop:10265 length:1563 start_codon:yes stop_codon:yes gene_type:complete
MPRGVSWTSLWPALLLAACSAVNAAAPSIQLPGTRLEGLLSADGGVEAFLGVKFAAAPVADLRWRAPQAVRYSTPVTEAREFGPACYQGDHIIVWYRDLIASFGGDPASISTPPVSEDCLYLNIWRPQVRGTAPLPVIVYVHGGSNRGGWSYEPNYIGENLAREKVLVVTVAYRLGAFGFFSHPDLAESNFALLDLIAALEWVQEHIEAAGGDPGNVTLVGESAGASNIAHLMVAPRARGLFRRVIHQSAGWAISDRVSREQQLASGLELQRELTGAAGTLDDLRNVPAGQLLAAADRVFEDAFFDPVVDGVTLTEPVAASLALGNFPPLDLLIGTNADEWLMYLDEDANLEAWARENLPPQLVAAVLAYAEQEPDSRRALDRLITAERFVCPSLYLAEVVTAAGGRSWGYYFSRQREGDKAASMGAYHGAELPYVFGTHDAWLPTVADDEALTRAMMVYWVNFARNGNPNGAGLPAWPAYTTKNSRVLRLDREITDIEHPSRELCALLQDTTGAPHVDD